MKNIYHKIYQNRHFLLFILLFAYLQSIYGRILIRQDINVYTFTPEAAFAALLRSGLLFVITLFFIRKWKKRNVFDSKTILKIFTSSLLAFVLVIQLIGFLVAIAFGNVERNFNSHTLSITLFSHFLDGIIYGCFFLAYYYYQSNKKQQQKLASYKESLAESKINQLKAQLNPHFLFNNLNVLDQLIEEDKHKASDFLNEFAEIYRYVLHSSDQELMTVEQEINFVMRYFKLIQHKYGSAYQLHIEVKNQKGLIVPMTLQLLIENAIQHNLGTKENPVYIKIKVDENITILNNLNLKQNNKSTSGRALKNLKEQYGLLSEHQIEFQQTENKFSVIVPIIHIQNK
ncbi:sensor histidine kinase [Flavobacterium chuncheonense]|uniref:Sensor histidine kinase n=1 Tax=Flavobacterium chuncheonense TaxID=2026653 RepID=A0ABW5YIS8_9FLAO